MAKVKHTVYTVKKAARRRPSATIGCREVRFQESDSMNVCISPSSPTTPDRHVNEAGYFEQADWEFALDTSPPHVVKAIEARLESVPPGELTAACLRDLAIAAGWSITPLE